MLRVLEVDPELGAQLDAETRAQALPELQVPELTLEPGSWNPPSSLAGSGPLGLLILRGLLTRRVEVAGGHSVEMLGAGDLIRPWQEDSASFVEPSWRILTKTSLGLLSREFGMRVCRYPQMVEALVGRTTQRARSLATNSAIDNVVRLQDSLLLVLWHIAERWGTVTPRGVSVNLPLTHEILADLVGARRPSVSSALGELSKTGALTRLGGRGWLLRGSPPSSESAPAPG